MKFSRSQNQFLSFLSGAHLSPPPEKSIENDNYQTFGKYVSVTFKRYHLIVDPFIVVVECTQKLRNYTSRLYILNRSSLNTGMWKNNFLTVCVFAQHAYTYCVQTKCWFV